MAEDAEECVLQVALQDVDRATALMRQERVTRAELVQALCYLTQSTKAAVDVAECRGERLPAQAGDDTEADTSD
ncbi:hypothetical protein [Streptomyces viridochromogenes]|uniref:hypothetical protein n=1 Tax=Streptomyces viridochromogenes TaxID=1938 RepID=UPI0011807F5F|nr:hypothetical protein [Streptomyces viridochromogenes]